MAINNFPTGHRTRPAINESPVQLLMIIILSIVVSDILVRIIIRAIPSLTGWVDVLLDSALVVLILFPFLYFLVFRPLTKFIVERKQAEEEVKKKNQQLEQVNAEKDKFFSILAHDLRGPMSAFVSITHLLTEEMRTMDQDQIGEFMNSMKSDAANLNRLLENLLEWSQLKRGVMEFNPQEFNLRKSINMVLDIVSVSARKKEIKIDNSVPDELEVFADLHMFESVVRNLASNAVKFTPVGGKIYVSAGTNINNCVEIRISDTGIGMDKILMSKLFIINEKTSRKGTEGEPSSGLGLLLCKEFIEKHRGKIWVESEAGKGATFYFSLPSNGAGSKK
jgi:signal transduction histidine kinase